MGSISDVVKFEVPRTLRKRSFWFTSFAPPIIIIVIIVISIVSNKNAQKSSVQQASTTANSSKIAVLDNSGLINQQQLTKLHIITEPSQQAGIDAVKENKIDAFFYYPANIVKNGIDIYSQDKGISFTPPYNTDAIGLLQTNVANRIVAATHSDQLVKLLDSTPNVATTTYKNGKQTNSLADIIAPGIFMIAFLTLVVLMSYIMITSSTEEKENRAAEIILTSIKSSSLILGKIFSIFVLGAVQIIAIVVPLLIAYAALKNRISLPGGVSLSHIPLSTEPVAVGVLFLAGGICLFTGLLVGLGALFPSAQDAGRYLGLSIISAFIPIYTLNFIVSSPHSLIVNVFTYFPLTAPTTVLLRNAVSAISTPEALIALLIVIASDVLAIMFAVRAFRYGAMEYGRRISIKELFH